MGLILPNQEKSIVTDNAIDLTSLIAQTAAQVAVDIFERMTVSSVKMKYKKLTETAKTPTYATKNDTCADLYADEDVTIQPHTVGKISTGLAFEAPEGFYFRILPRSGMSSNGIIVTAGVVDNQYRGDIIVALHNSTNEVYEVHKGDKIAQVEMRNFHQMEMEEVTKLSETERGNGGFGSSGK